MFVASCSSTNSEEASAQKMVEAIIKSVATDDFELYNSVLITKEDLLSHGKKIGNDGNRIPEEKILKDIVEPSMRNRKLGFDLYKQQKVNWSQINVDSVKVTTRKLMEAETGKFKVYYVYEGKRCVMTYNSVMRTDDGDLKIGNVPSFGACID